MFKGGSHDSDILVLVSLPGQYNNVVSFTFPYKKVYYICIT